MRQKALNICSKRWFDYFITFVISINLVVLIGQAELRVSGSNPDLLLTFEIVDNICLAIYVFELIIKITAYGKAFFKDGWNIFDFIIVAVSFVPLLYVDTQVLRVLRVVRAARGFRLFSADAHMRVIVEALFKSIPGVISVLAVLFVLYIVYAIVGIELYGAISPEYFGTFGAAMFTLFQLMTFENWPTIATSVMELHPVAWTYFVSFLILAAYLIINVIMGVIIRALEDADNSFIEEEIARDVEQTEMFREQIGDVKSQIAALQASIDKLTENKSAEENRPAENKSAEENRPAENQLAENQQETDE